MIRGIGLRGAVAVNVITMIGIGPLITIPLVLSALHGSTALVAWVVGALIALCDGLAWAELGSLYPGSGGTYVFLREAFGRERWGRLLAFLFAWQIVLSAPLVLASGYIGFANYAGYLYRPLATDVRLEGIVAAAVAVVTLAALYRPIRTVGAIGIVLAAVAIATLGAVIAAALTRFSPAQALSADPTVGFGAALAAGLGPALVITLYDYYGYGASSTIGDEVRDTKRVLPRSVIASIVLVGLLYVALQVGVLGVVSWHELVPSTPGGDAPAAANYVASIVVERTLGSWPARIVTVTILVTAFASTFGNLLAYSRIPFSAARDGVFLAPFAKLDERGRFPNVSLAAIGLLAIPACFLSLGDVINALTAGLVIIQSIAQLVAVIALRAKGIRAPYRMWLFPAPLFIALAGWVYIFFSSGPKSIAFGLVSLAAGVVIYAIRAGRVREWPFARASALVAVVTAGAVWTCAPAFAENAASAGTWGHADIVNDSGNPVFRVDGKPFFVYGAAFFYERLPRDRWSDSMAALKHMGINTLDLYVPWNWHELSDGRFDFTGQTSARRDLDEVLRLARAYDFKILLRPGPVVRNEWRNGGYPAWLLSRPEYGMPLHDLLEGRYPPTATLQNQHSDDAAAAWMNNATHMAYAKRWIERVLRECEPDADLILAVALDDDQGAYIDNQTYPAPHFQAYIDALKSWVTAITGPSELVYINTYQMKVTAQAPVWAMGNWYQSDALSIGEHDRAQLEFSTSLLHTQPHLPMMTSEFQAGWLEQPDDIRPRPADPSNTLLAMSTMIGMGVRGIVNFPAQDTLNPSGWEAPFANAFYGWDAALGFSGGRSERYAPTEHVGALVRLFGPELASAVPMYDGAIAYLGASFEHRSDNPFFSSVAAETMLAQRACRDAGLACALVDIERLPPAALARFSFLIAPQADDMHGAALRPKTLRAFAAYAASGGIVIRSATPGGAALLSALRERHRVPIVSGLKGATFARDTTGKLAGFLSITNYDDTDLSAEHAVISDGIGNVIELPPFTLAKHAGIVVPVDLRLKAFVPDFQAADRLRFTTCMPSTASDRDLDEEVFGPRQPRPKAFFVYFRSTDDPACQIFVRVGGHDATIDSRTSAGVVTSLAEPLSPFVKPIETGASLRSDATALSDLPIASGAAISTTIPAVPDGQAQAYESDVYRDGSKCVVFDNTNVALVVSEAAGARAFAFVDKAREDNIFTTVGGLRDDVAIEPPLSTTDRIAKYTHQFPAGMFNRPYEVSALSTGDRAAATFTYDAPDIVPSGALLTRTITLEPNARSFTVDESVHFHDGDAEGAQRIVSVTSIGVGAPPDADVANTLLSPAPSAFAAGTTVHVSAGDALGIYNDASHQLATIAWHAGDVEDAAILERTFSSVVRLTLARDRPAHVRYGYEIAPNLEAARALIASAGIAAQVSANLEKGTTTTPRTP